MLPLQGIKVVALEQAVAAPFATRQLADLGARVIKIERPGVGDFARHYDTAANGLSSHFVWLNRSKESLALDLKDQEAKGILEGLLEDADVFISNLAPGATDRLGFGAKELLQKYPKLIICSISGYGSEGPYKDKKAYDLLIQCEAGLVSITGTEEIPSKAGISIADIAAGMYAFSGIQTALINRHHTGEGSIIEVSMLEALGEWMGFPVNFAFSGEEPKRTGADHATIFPYGDFEVAEGKKVFIGIQNEREWENFCVNVVHSKELFQNEKFNTNTKRSQNKDELRKIINQKFKGFTADLLMQELDKQKIANARLNTIGEFIDHPQLKFRDRWRDVDSSAGKLKMLVPPVTFNNIGYQMNAIPEVGQHNERILRELKGKVN
ncbi:CaiB/BaiF CoA transferase family protein [Planococcus sp. YIM B11945]|uniref:CaiB/BaiF CoA transferase family protein n=1 Tax=Planococcus sp. YIM B11945 TaxID=3435410 RepID=UPI003D7EFA72